MSRTPMNLSMVIFGLTSAAPAAAIFPQLALGGGYECVLIVSNKKDTAWEGTVEALQQNRVPWIVGWRHNNVLFGGRSELELSLPPKASRKIEIFGDQTVQNGYLKITSGSGHSDLDVACSFFYNFRDGGGNLLDSTGVTWDLADKEFMMPVERSVLVNTGFAWAPLLSSAYKVELTLYDRDGNVAATATVEQSGHLARFFSEVFDGVPEEFIGMMYIDSDSYLYLTALRLEFSAGGFQLTSVPPDDFMP